MRRRTWSDREGVEGSFCRGVVSAFVFVSGSDCFCVVAVAVAQLLIVLRCHGRCRV